MGSSMKLVLTPRQSGTVAAAATALAAGVILSVALGVFFLLARFVAIFSSVFLPLFVAIIVALVLRPVQQFFQKKLHAPPAASTVLVFLSVLAPLGLFVWFFGVLAASQISELVGKLPELTDRAQVFIETHWPQVKQFGTNTG